MTTALLTALALSIGLGYFGWLVKKQIWNGAESPSAPLDYGRKFASYVVVAASISGANFFIKDDFFLALFKFAIVLVVFAIFGFIAGWAYGFLRCRLTSKSTEADLIATSREPKLNSVTKFSSLRTIGFLVLAMVLVYSMFQIDFFGGVRSTTKNQKWVPIANLYIHSWMENDGKPKFEWIEENSIQKLGGYTYAFIGSDVPSQGADEVRFRKFKVEADCSIPKYRKIEKYEYSGNVADAFGKLIAEDKNFQKTVAEINLKALPNYVHTGGWASREESQKDMKTYSSSPYDDVNRYGHMLAYAKRDLAILNWLCN